MTHPPGAPAVRAARLDGIPSAVRVATSPLSTARAAFARRLESDRPPALAARILASAWGVVSSRCVTRPLALPSGIRAIGVGGASLGGSGKTPLAIAVAEALAARGIDVAIVGHAYRARPGRARVVRAEDDVVEVGDDALFAARRLARLDVDVIVAPSRQAATLFAAHRARWLVFDGLLQSRPERLARSILLVGGGRAWSSGDCPPAGDLRAPPEALLRATDLPLFIHDEIERKGITDALSHGHGTAGALSWGDPAFPTPPPPGPTALPDAVSHLDRAVSASGRRVSLSDLAGTAIGLVLAIARPERVIEGLARRGLHPAVTLVFPDHHRPTASELAASTANTTHRIEAWLTTGKCATKLPAVLAGAPVLALEHAIHLSDRLVGWVVGEGTPRAP